MGIKKIAYTIAFLATATLGGIVGRYSALDMEYRIQRNDQVNLQVISLQKSYTLTKLGNEVYLGDSSHNLNGVKQMGVYEGKQTMGPEIKALHGQVTDLETKIAKRQLTDQIEDIGDDIKDGWRNFKHNLLDNE